VASIIVQDLDDGSIDFVDRQRLRTIVGVAVERRLRRKPVAAGLLVEISGADGQLAQRLAEDGS
jgi:hypothetical protein